MDPRIEKMIEAAKGHNDGGEFFPSGNDAGREIQDEDRWGTLALAPFTTGRDADLVTMVNWDVVCEEIKADGIRTGDVRVNNPFNGWNVQLYFDAGHEPTVAVILSLLDRLENDPCLDRERLAEEERDRITEWVNDERGWHAFWAGQIETARIVAKIYERDEFDGPESVLTSWIIEAVEEIISETHHDFEVQPEQDDPERCKCGEPKDARLHRDKEFEQIPGQLCLEV